MKTETDLSHNFLLREAADNYANDFTKVVIGDVQAHSFKQGANWQSKHSYSEQEVIEIIKKVLDRQDQNGFVKSFVRFDDLLKK